MNQPRQAPKTGQAVQPEPPPSVLNAVKCMYAGAALSALTAIFQFALLPAERSQYEKLHPHFSAAHIHAAVVSQVVQVTITGVISIALWIVMARTNMAGRSWARLVASVLFGLNTIDGFTSARAYGVGIGSIPNALIWLAGLAAIVLLWRGESSAYISAVTEQRRMTGQLR